MVEKHVYDGRLNNQETHPVLMAIISISGFFRILGRSKAAPPILRPSLFFLPSSRTVLPRVEIILLISLKCINQSLEI